MDNIEKVMKSIDKSLQSIASTLKRIEIIVRQDIRNRSFFWDDRDLYKQMSEAGLTDSHAEQELNIGLRQDP